ncbi:hypothetical protein D0C16_10095 [Cellvibrio sp. KY-GH-1]|uniref:ABC transporter permease n=1 Tax=Cellvibrio sp. KY-GH-1 TaxID=2303332 RepID=UPI001244CE87|nr:ABC transporter permease [Cellvibrio sp. KY-GH-1]QEY16299.1 hypothetical protein D0C16_10095 [Cellvibrio sp. KY-GH-1]
MFWYPLQLALRSIRKAPILSSVMVFVLATGVAITTISYTHYYHLKKNPLAHKDENLFLLQTDSWDAKHQYENTPNKLPPLHSYRDSMGLLASNIPLRKTAITNWGGSIHNPDLQQKALFVRGHITTHDFFSMFEHEFIYGAPWNATADDHFQNVIVISDDVNQQLFGGKNSVGKSVVYESAHYQIVGVVKKKLRTNPTYEIALYRWPQPDAQFYFPISILKATELGAWIRYECPEDTRDYGSHWYQPRLINSCTWISLWFEFADDPQKTQFEEFVRSYIQEQKKSGNYPRPLRFALTSIGDYMHLNQAAYDEDNTTIYLGAFTLLVCTLNFVALLLAKFMRALPESGVRRALGANRQAIFMQHLLESTTLGAAAGALGVVMTIAGLWYVKLAWKSAPPPANGLLGPDNVALMEPDLTILASCIATALLASLCAGLYPAWQACRVAAANYLKIQ